MLLIGEGKKNLEWPVPSDMEILQSNSDTTILFSMKFRAFYEANYVSSSAFSVLHVATFYCKKTNPSSQNSEFHRATET